MIIKSKDTIGMAAGQGPEEDISDGSEVEIKKKSRVPGVMIVQFVETIPEGKNHPDFTRKPIALTIQEGKSSFFKAIVVGDPAPTVTWTRNNGDISDTTRYHPRYDKENNEHLLELPNVKPDQQDTYKCTAINEYGRAIVTVVLNVIAVGMQKNKQPAEQQNAEDFKRVLNRKSKVRPKSAPKNKDELDPKFWEILLSADKKDYEAIMAEYGITDFRWMLKKLNEMKQEREEEQAEFVKNISKLKPIDVNGDGSASFEMDMDLINPNSTIFLYKDGEMVAFSREEAEKMKHTLNLVGSKYTFSIKDLLPDDAGLYQVDVEDVNVFSTDFKIPVVDFLVKIKEVKAVEREDAVFECVLSNPFSKIKWFGKNLPLEQGEKYDVEVSDDKLIHRLVIKDCMVVDKGIFSACAGIKSCNAWLLVEADKTVPKGKKTARKTTKAGGSGEDLAKIAQEQQVKLEEKRAEIKVEIEAAKQAAKDAPAPTPEATAPGTTTPTAGPTPPAATTDTGASTGGSDTAEPASTAEAPKGTDTSKSGASTVSIKGSDSQDVGSSGKSGASGVSIKGSDSQDVGSSEPTITSGLSDIYAVRGQPAELLISMNTDAKGTWSKDGEELTSKRGASITKDGNSHKLTITSCDDDHQGLYRFVSGDTSTEGKLIVGDLPEFDPDDLHKFSKPVIIKVGQTATFKMPFPPQESGMEITWFKDGSELKDGGGVKINKEPNHSKLLLRDCLRMDSGEIKIQLKNPFGVVEATSQLIVIDRPGPPDGPVELVETSSSMVEIKWNPPKDDGGSAVTNYIIERQQTGHNQWTKLGDVRADNTNYRDRNVNHGKKYNYRVYAENPEGLSDALETENAFMAGVLILSGPPGAPDVVSASKTCVNLTWTCPENDRGEPIIGYQLEKRKKDTTQWIALNAVNEPIEGESYAVKAVTEGSEYEFRVAAINKSGAGDLSPPSKMVCAKNPPMRPRFKDPEDFMVVRAGNSMRIKINYEAEPAPDIIWSKDDEPVSMWTTVVNTEGMSQLVIPSSKRSDSGVFTIKAKNSSGEAKFDIDVRVTEEPKSPGPVAIEQTVHGKVVLTWAPSPDQELDDRLYYVVAEHNSTSRVWKNVGDRIYGNTYTAINIEDGREYHFNVYAKNDMGLSDPSRSPTWGANSNRVPLALTGGAAMTPVKFEKSPSILVPLKVHAPPKGYQLYMTCAVRGTPTPNVKWYLNDVCINQDKNYYITNAYGICSISIIRVRLQDSGEYRVVALNSLGRAECSTKLKVRD